MTSAEAASPKPGVWAPWMPGRRFPEGAASVTGAAPSPQFCGLSFACCSGSAPPNYKLPWGRGHTGPRLDLLELCLVAGAEGPQRELITNCASVTGSATGARWNDHLPAVCLTLPCCFSIIKTSKSFFCHLVLLKLTCWRSNLESELVLAQRYVLLLNGWWCDRASRDGVRSWLEVCPRFGRHRNPLFFLF